MASIATYQLWSDPAEISSTQQGVEPALHDWSGSLGLDNEVGAAYSEEVFRYFLEIERKRAEFSSRPLLLLLVDFQASPAQGRTDSDSSDRVFEALTDCLRDTDFVGWYHQSRVIGAVLTQRAEAPTADATRQVTDRVNRRLLATLPAGIAHRLQIRVFQLTQGERSLEGA